MANIARVCDYLFITRPVLFYPIWTTFLAGFLSARFNGYAGLPFESWPRIQGVLVDPYFWVTFWALTFLMAAVFIINQFTDVHTDRENNKLFLLANGIVSKSAARLETLILLAAAFLPAAFSSLQLFALIVLLFIITGVAYSVPPFLWKDRPFAGLLVNLLGGLLTFLVGWQIEKGIDPTALLRSVPYIFAIGAVYFLTTIPDMRGDRHIGKMTFAVKYGVRRTILAGLFFETACVISAAVLKDGIVFLPAILSFPLFLSLLRDPSDHKIVPATRFPILFLSVAVAIFFPAYLLLMLAIFLLSKWYYRYRFSLNYPSLTQIVKEEG